MTKHRAVLFVLGAAGLALGLAAAVADLAALGIGAGALAMLAAVIAAFHPPAPATHDSDELEAALAAQVQARLTAEEAVRSLGQQLAEAQRQGTAKASQLGMPLADRKADTLTDAATGLFSEEYFKVAVDARIAAARRHLRPVGVVILEVIEGLRTDAPNEASPGMVAEVVNATLREADTASRVQGGRFALVLEDTGENGAIWTVERIRRALSDHAQNLTLRAGIACYPAHAFGAAEVLRRAHDALIAAQDWQQDRIEVATGD